MTPLVQSVTTIFSALTVLAGAGTLALFVMLIVERKDALHSRAFVWITKHAAFLGFITVFGALITSLFYSEVAHFAPCLLCWFARLLFLPQPALFALYMMRRQVWVAKISILLSSLGALLMTYQSYLQFGGTDVINCGAIGVSCAKRYFLEFGYVTIPTMALTTFLMLLALMLAAKRQDA